MPPEKYSRNGVIQSRLTLDVRSRLDAIHERHRTNDSQIMAALVEAFVDAVESADAVRFPVVVLLAEKQVLRAAEDPETKPKLAIKEKPPDKGKSKRGAGPDADVRKPA